MPHALKLHPESRCDAVRDIAVEVVRGPGGALSLTYYLTGTIADLYVPQRAAPERTDELWRRTCFEAFIRGAGEPYVEFNFSPSTQWAAYGFTRYREGMADLAEVSDIAIDVRVTASGLELRAPLALGRVAILPAEGAWHLALSAVIEEANGRVSFWGFAHPPGKPEFHHSDCFALPVPPASGAA